MFMVLTMRVLAIDPGEKRIGVAISDPTATIARPLCIIAHQSRAFDAQTIAGLAKEHGCSLIVIGQALDSNGAVGVRARSSQRLKNAIIELINVPVILWDESNTTKTVSEAQIALGLSRKKRSKAKDDMAAAILLDDFLTSQVFKNIKENDGEEI